MHQDDKNPKVTEASEAQSAQPELIGPPPPSYRNPVAAVLLFLSGVGLWSLAALAAIVVCATSVVRFDAIGPLFLLFEYGTPVAVGSIVLLVLFAFIHKPWRAGRMSVAFSLQMLIALFAMLAIAASILEERRVEIQRASEDQRKEQVKDDERIMQEALQHDNVTGFSSAYADCANYCSRDTWIGLAVLANAPRILGVVLKGITRETYSKIDGTSAPMFCKRGVLYHFPHSLARFVGFRNSPVITAQFAALWGPEDRDHAFMGAAMAGSTEFMDALVKQGVNPRALNTESASDDVYASAAAGAAAGSIAWLVRAGVKVQTADSAEYVWRSLAEWAQYAPPEVAAKGGEAWLAESSRILFAPGAKLTRADALGTVVYTESPVLVEAMLRHGYRAADLDADSQERLKTQLARPATQQYEQTDRIEKCGAEDWTATR